MKRNIGSDCPINSGLLHAQALGNAANGYCRGLVASAWDTKALATNEWAGANPGQKVKSVFFQSSESFQRLE